MRRTISLLRYFHPPYSELFNKEKEIRKDLAAAYRLIFIFGWNEVIYNHISARLPGSQNLFLLNPFGLGYEEITASSLIIVDDHGEIIDPGSTNGIVNRAGFILHSAIHSSRPDIQCVLHTHEASVATISSMQCGLLPLSKESDINVSYHEFEGISIDEDQRGRIVSALGKENLILLLKNHGVVACEDMTCRLLSNNNSFTGKSVTEAVQNIHRIHRACSIQVAAMSAVDDISKLHLIRDSNFPQKLSLFPFDKFKQRLDKTDPSYQL